MFRKTLDRWLDQTVYQLERENRFYIEALDVARAWVAERAEPLARLGIREDPDCARTCITLVPDRGFNRVVLDFRNGAVVIAERTSYTELLVTRRWFESPKSVAQRALRMAIPLV